MPRTHEELATQFGTLAESEFLILAGIAPATAKSWRALGRGPPYALIGNAVVYPIAGIAEWIESETRQRLSVGKSSTGKVDRSHLL